jgi:hypothetical protein
MVAEQSTQLLGNNFLPSLVLALGSALVVGNVLALVRPQPRAGDVVNRRTRVRSAAMIALGALCSAWAVASMVS